MAKGSKTRRVLKKVAGYGAVFSVAFLLTVYWSFPYDLVADRVVSAVEQRTGLALQVQNLRPWWVLGLKADDVKITRPATRGGDPLEVKLPSLAARLEPISSLFGGPAFAFAADMDGGEVTGTFQQRDGGKEMHVALDLDDVEVGKIPGLWDHLGMGMKGTASGEVDVTMPPGKPDALNGKATVALKGAKFGGGMLRGFTVPSMDLGDVNLDLTIDKGKVRFDPPLKVASKDLSAEVSGDIDLRPIFVTSRANLDVRFKPTDAFWAPKPKVARLAQAFLKNARGADGWYGYQLGGVLGRPSFQPKR